MPSLKDEIAELIKRVKTTKEPVKLNDYTNRLTEKTLEWINTNSLADLKKIKSDSSTRKFLDMNLTIQGDKLIPTKNLTIPESNKQSLKAKKERAVRFEENAKIQRERKAEEEKEIKEDKLRDYKFEMNAKIQRERKAEEEKEMKKEEDYIKRKEKERSSEAKANWM